MQVDLGSVWNPETRLGRAAPRGRGPSIVLNAPELDQVSVEDVRRCVRNLMGLPHPPPPPPAPPEPAAEAGPPDEPDVAPEPAGRAEETPAAGDS